MNHLNFRHLFVLCFLCFAACSPQQELEQNILFEPTVESIVETAEAGQATDNEVEHTDQFDEVTAQPDSDTDNITQDDDADSSTGGEVVLQPGRIEFEPGAASTTLNGEIGAGTAKQYVLQIADGQMLAIELSGPETAGIIPSDSTGSLIETETPVTEWTTPPLKTGDVTITIESQTAGSYALSVTLINRFQDQGRFEIVPGATDKTISGDIAEGASDVYVVSATEGQYVKVSQSSGEGGYITIRDEELDATVYHATFAESFEEAIPLPRSADYLLFITPRNPGPYSIHMIIDNLEPGAFTGGNTDLGWIEFDSGTTSKTISGNVEGESTDHYTISAAEGQYLTVELNDGKAAVFILKSVAADRQIEETFNSVSSWSVGPLPVSGDYALSVFLDSPGPYELTLTRHDSQPGGD